MSSESHTSTEQNDRPAGTPGEGSTAGPYGGVPTAVRTVTKPPTPAPGGRAAAHFRGAQAADYQLAVALTWLGRGHPVIPCSKRTKRPLVGGFEARATPADLAPFYDPEQARRWWEGEFRGAHVGLLTRHLLVVDCDMPKGPAALTGRFAGCQDGTDVLALRLAEVGAEWPTTYTVLTPGGGVHLLFEQPIGREPIGCRTGTGRKDPDADPAPGHVGPLVDVRGVGGFIIAPGSYSTEQGRPYERISPTGTGIAPLPDSILQLVVRPKSAPAPTPARPMPTRYSTRADRYAESALSGAAKDIREAEQGRGNATLFARARRLGELSHTAPHIITLSEVERVLGDAALDRGRDWTAHEALATIRSGWTKGLQSGAVA